MQVYFKWYLSGEDVGPREREALPKRGDRFPLQLNPFHSGTYNVLVIFVEEPEGSSPVVHVSSADAVWERS